MAMDLVGIGLKNQSERYFSQIRYNPSLLPFKAGGCSLGSTAKYTAKASYRDIPGGQITSNIVLLLEGR